MAINVFSSHSQIPEHYLTMDEAELNRRVQEIKARMGDALVLLGHHYQKDEVFQYADVNGDSLKLAQLGAQQQNAKYIVFCGVHFMAETADILSDDDQTVVLPDMKAGCSMADMADDLQVEECWDVLTEELGETIIPITYVNSTAAIKAFVGRHGGLTCTSSNAHKVLEWAFKQKKRVLFLPDQHLGRNTAYSMGIPLEQMAVYDPHTLELEDVKGEREDLRVILWKGFCSVHTKFNVKHVERIRREQPNMRVLVHPECTFDVVQAADDSGSTEYIIKQVRNAPAGSEWAIGTEVNLVQRLAQEHPEQKIVLLNDMICPCLTMNRIDLPHLTWALESIEKGEPNNPITVAPDIAESAKLALDRMLELS